MFKKLIKYVIVYPVVAVFGLAVVITAWTWNDPENVQARDRAAIERAAEAEVRAATKAAEEAREAERVAQEAAQKKQKGFHCLSSWDGSHKQLTRAVESVLRNPDSFEHIETRITPVNAALEHTVIMEYRAQNGFGGMNVEQIVATVDHNSCVVKQIISQ